MTLVDEILSANGGKSCKDQFPSRLSIWWFWIDFRVMLNGPLKIQYYVVQVPLPHLLINGQTISVPQVLEVATPLYTLVTLRGQVLMRVTRPFVCLLPLKMAISLWSRLLRFISMARVSPQSAVAPAPDKTRHPERRITAGQLYI